jgi:signal peptidase I
MPQRPENPEDQKLGLAAEMLRRRGTVRLRAWGASMLPSVWPGDLLTIESSVYDEVVPGDIVLVMRDNRFVVHRLIEMQQDQGRFLWITRGDTMPHSDPPAVTSELLGRVAGISRAHRSFVPSRRISALHSALAWMLCRWDRLRNLALRIHAARLQTNRAFAGEVFRSVFSEAHGILDTSASRASHP